MDVCIGANCSLAFKAGLLVTPYSHTLVGRAAPCWHPYVLSEETFAKTNKNLHIEPFARTVYCALKWYSINLVRASEPSIRPRVSSGIFHSG